jgi:hypothetical protein
LEESGYPNTTIEQMILNPIIEDFEVLESGWNIFLLTNNGSSTYACDIPTHNISNFTCFNSTELGVEFIELIEKLWYD